jgi:nucleotide-binding universal stress UspA family protein
MESFRKACLEQAIPFSYRLMEGKNWLELAREVRAHPYDLVIIGILGLGAVNGNFIGGVCERVVRNISTDVLVVKNGTFIGERVVAAIDGSDEAFSAFRKALVLGKMFGVEVEALSVYDPHFHRRAFQALVGVLSEEAGKVFRFREQEKLHDEIIDDGLGKIYRGYLDRAVEMGLDEGVHVKSTLLAGKASTEICKYLETRTSALLVISRFGAHKTDEQDIGNTAENLLRFARCNVLITHGAQAE